MATFDYNPITGNLDLVGSGASYIDGVVADSSLLPVTLGAPPLDAVYLAKAGSGVWLINRKPAGLYCRVANNGNANDWVHLGAFPEVNADGNWELYNSADPTKELKFDLSGLPTATVRTVTAPAGNGQMLVEGQSIGSTTRNSGAFTTLNANNGTLTASAPVLDLSQTWNNAAVTFTGLRFNVTNTASAAASNIAEFQVGGTTQFSVRRDGVAQMANGAVGYGQGGIANRIGFYVLGTERFRADGTGLFTVMANGGFSWTNSSANPLSGTSDLFLRRDAAGTVGQHDGANPQAYRLYNTTDAGLTNFERGFLRWSSNVLQIGTEAGGTGSARNLEFQTGGTTRWILDTNGRLYPLNSPSQGGFQLSSGYIVYRVGSANVMAWVDGHLTAQSTGFFQWSGTTDAGNFSGDWLRLSRSAGGSLLLSAGTSTNHIFQFGGTTSSFPALKRSSTALQVRLADDSAYSVLDAQLRAQGTAPATSGATGTAGDIRYDADYIYICTAANTWKRAAIATW